MLLVRIIKSFALSSWEMVFGSECQSEFDPVLLVQCDCVIIGLHGGGFACGEGITNGWDCGWP